MAWRAITAANTGTNSRISSSTASTRRTRATADGEGRVAASAFSARRQLTKAAVGTMLSRPATPKAAILAQNQGFSP